MIKIVISGYYGFGNTGDEAVLAGILATFRHISFDAQITVLSGDPERTMLEHPGVLAIHRYKLDQMIKAIRQADLVISGGGSLLQDATSARSSYYYLFVLILAQLLCRKTMIYAQGVGPLNLISIRRAVSQTLNKVSAITVRDSDSKSLLENIGVSRTPVTLSADPTFFVEPDVITAAAIFADLGLNNQEIIGVSLRPWTNSEKWLPEISEGIRQACTELGVKAILIPMQESEDTQICESTNCGVVVKNIGGVHAVKGIISKCSLVVGMRLHSLIFAAGEGVPFVPVIYDPKVASFASLTDQGKGVDIESLTADQVKEAIVNAWTNRKALSAKLTQNVFELRKLAETSAHIARELAQSKEH